MNCRGCNKNITTVFADLINAPASNSYLKDYELDEPEDYYPLKVYVCNNCYLVQIEEYKKSDHIFNQEYAYFSSFSKSWLKHAKDYTDKITKLLNLNQNSSVIEIASNDGYLLKNFIEKQIPCIGIEPAESTAKEAKKHGIFSYQRFWSSKFAYELIDKHGKQDLIIGNNVLAHTPEISDFIHGLKIALAKNGTITLEFPHLLNLIQKKQFDTIYHEHFSYLSLLSVEPLLNKDDLEVYFIEELKTHGGSLRLYIKHKQNYNLQISNTVELIRNKEINFHLNKIKTYKSFQTNIDKIKYDFIDFLLKAKHEGKVVIAYGAAAKGNTLLNYSGIKGCDLIKYVVDASTYKQGLFLPGSHIPVVAENEIKLSKPDYIIIFPWNIKDEISTQLSYTKEWNCKFVTAIPELAIF